jgi:hypothetical protein
MALLKSLKYRYFGAESPKSLEKVNILALNMTIFLIIGTRADLGWPWLSLSKKEIKIDLK